MRWHGRKRLSPSLPPPPSSSRFPAASPRATLPTTQPGTTGLPTSASCPEEVPETSPLQALTPSIPSPSVLPAAGRELGDTPGGTRHPSELLQGSTGNSSQGLGPGDGRSPRHTPGRGRLVPVLVCLVSPQLRSPVPSAPVNRYPNSSGTVTEELGPHLLPGHRKHQPDLRQAWWLGAWAPDPTCAGPWLGRRPAEGQRPVLIATCSPNREGVVTTQSPVTGLLGAHPRPRLSSTHTWFLDFKRQTYRLERDKPPPNSQAVTSHRLRYKFQTSLDNEGEGPPLGSWFPQRWIY